MALICDRCGDEIRGGHHFCDPKGIKMVQDFDKRFEEWKKSQDKAKK